ncbi:MAG: nuclear transport factor 2 family protein, partial [Desulfobacterales bacterium]|nr:nuclear transport factor 2 family protein [Desulfobacterales bacterium]
DSYIQHNRNLPDKIQGLVGFLREFVQDYPDYTYDVKHIYADGDYVTFHSHATLKKEDRGNDQKGMNIIDTWRIENGKIVEHWDSIQPLDVFMRFYAWMNGGDIRNKNGVF